MRHDTCPWCHTSLQGEPIAAEHQAHKDDCDDQKARYNGNCYCRPWGDATHFRREIGIEVQGVYDGVLYWRCPDCDRAWERDFGTDVRLKLASLAHVADHNEQRGAA